MATMNATTTTLSLRVGSSNNIGPVGSSSPTTNNRVFYNRLSAPSLWKQRCVGGAGAGTMRSKKNGRTALHNAEALSMEGEFGSVAAEKEQQRQADDAQWISREDTVGSDAAQVLEDFTSGGEKEREEEQGKVGSEAFDSRNEKELDDIEQQYLLNDKLVASATGVKAAVESIPGNSEAVGNNLKKVVEEARQGDVQDQVTSSNPSSSSSPAGRDWRVWANGINDEKSKIVIPWTEKRCDEGSLFKKTIETGKAADRLGHLEELVIEKDDSNSAEDYNRRAAIFEKSNEAIKAERECDH